MDKLYLPDTHMRSMIVGMTDSSTINTNVQFNPSLDFSNSTRVEAKINTAFDLKVFSCELSHSDIAEDLKLLRNDAMSPYIQC